MSEDNKALIRRYMDLYNEYAWERLGELLDPGYVHHSNDAELNLAQFVRGATWIIAGLPDFRVEIADLVAEGDRVATRWVGTGTHQGSFFGETPTSRSIVLHGITLYRIADERIAEDWEAMDEADLRQQVEAPPAE